MTSENHTFIIDEDLITYKRIDKILTAAMQNELSRARIQGLIKEGCVTRNGQMIDDPSLKIAMNDEIHLHIPPAKPATPMAENIPLDIIYEDDDLLVINKQTGLTVHPGAGNPSGTLVNALLFHCAGQLSGIGGVERPGIVHRLDKETSGLMVVAKNDHAHQHLSAQLKDRSLTREYWALVFKNPMPRKGQINGPIGRDPGNRLKMATRLARPSDLPKDPPRGWRVARTFYKIQANYGEALSTVKCKLESGRTHQIRVHMQALGHPLIGDPLYGAQSTAIASAMRKAEYSQEIIAQVLAFPRQALHAQNIAFIHPQSDQEMSFSSPLPEDLLKLIDLLA